MLSSIRKTSGVTRGEQVALCKVWEKFWKRKGERRKMVGRGEGERGKEKGKRRDKGEHEHERKKKKERIVRGKVKY